MYGVVLSFSNGDMGRGAALDAAEGVRIGVYATLGDDEVDEALVAADCGFATGEEGLRDAADACIDGDAAV